MSAENREQCAFWALAALTALNILSFPVFPSQDGGAHAYYAEAWRGVLAGEAPYSGAYVVRGAMPPYSLDLWLRGGLQEAVSSIWAEKLVAAVTVLLFLGGFRSFAGAMASWLALPFAVNKQLMMGFTNFSLGLGILFYLLAFWRRSIWLTWGLVTLLMFTHPVPLLFGLLYMSAQAAVGGWQRREIMIAGGSWASALYVLSFTGGGGVTLDWKPAKLGEKLVSLLDLVPVSPLESLGYRLLLATAISFGLVLAWRAVRRGERRMEHLLPLAAGLGCLALFPLLPFSVNGSYFFDERFPLFGLLLVFRSGAHAPVSERGKRRMTWVLAAITLLGLGWQQMVLRPYADALAVVGNARTVRAGARGAIVAQPKQGWGGVLWNPCQWSAGHYFARSHALLVNNPWMNLPIMALRPTAASESDTTDPEGMAQMLGQQKVPLDFAIVEDCQSSTRPAGTWDEVMARQGLKRAPWGSDRFVFYAKEGE
jgi:hypothetical protein